jgi:hypothetical protein
VDATLRYTLLGFGVTALLDKGEALDIDDTRKHVEDGSLFGWLKQKFGDGIDLSLCRGAGQADVLERFGSLANTTDSRRKFGVEHNGLALLAAYCFEVLQQMHYSGQ